jgi:hypothetical protein
MTQQKNPEWNLTDTNRIYTRILSDLRKGIWPIFNYQIKVWLKY